GRPTLYGTEEGLKAVALILHRANLSLHVDFVLNHNGFSNLGTPGFVAAGGYPGLAIALPNDIDGDFHSAFAGGDIQGRLAGAMAGKGGRGGLQRQEKETRICPQPRNCGPPQKTPPPERRRVSGGWRMCPIRPTAASTRRSATTRFLCLIPERMRVAFRYTASISKTPPPEILSLRMRWDTSCATRSGWYRSSALTGSASMPRSMSRGSCSTSSIALSTARIRESSS